MTRKKKPLPFLQNIEISAVAAEGKALARVGELVVFVPFAVPGDVVDLRVTRKKRNYCEAEVVRFVKLSERRAVPACRHFGVCGGCKWQNLPYEAQLEAKQQQVYDQLTRIGKLHLPEIRPIIGSDKTTHYRNKLEFGCSNKRWLTRQQIESGDAFPDTDAIGFHITGSFDKILPIEECILMDDTQNKIRNEISHYAKKSGMSFYDIRNGCGLLRDIVVRNSTSGEWMVIIQFCFGGEDDKEKAMRLLEHIATKFSEITSLLWINNQKCNDTFGDLDVNLYKGRDFIIEKMDGLQFKVGPKSFYQTNSMQALKLYSVARDFANLSGNELVYDLYTGTGTIANFVARSARHIIGIEYVADAIADAKVNSQINGITNTEFFAGDMKNILNDDFISAHGHPDVIITDPPRAGMHPDVIATILKAEPSRIVYVSCNPATQARDLAALCVAYTVVAVQPVDMFPQTPHVENVVLLTKKKFNL